MLKGKKKGQVVGTNVGNMKKLAVYVLPETVDGINNTCETLDITISQLFDISLGCLGVAYGKKMSELRGTFETSEDVSRVLGNLHLENIETIAMLSAEVMK